jgi:hypothetical protein
MRGEHEQRKNGVRINLSRKVLNESIAAMSRGESLSTTNAGPGSEIIIISKSLAQSRSAPDRISELVQSRNLLLGKVGAMQQQKLDNDFDAID